MGPAPTSSSCVTRSATTASSLSLLNATAPAAPPKVSFPKMASPALSPATPSTLSIGTSPSLSANVPHLDSEGTNWATFTFRFHRVMMLAGRWGYLDGSDARPIPKDPDNPMDTKKLEGRQWVRDNTIAQCLLSQRLPDKLAMDMEKYPTVKEQWDVISILFTVKSKYVKTDLHQAFLNMRCPKGGDVREFLTTLRKKRHKLKWQV